VPLAPALVAGALASVNPCGWPRFHLGRLYPHVTLIEGNDARFDVGVLSKLPLGGVTSWQHQVHPADPAQRGLRP
jgi:hypothetical protein